MARIPIFIVLPIWFCTRKRSGRAKARRLQPPTENQTQEHSQEWLCHKSKEKALAVTSRGWLVDLFRRECGRRCRAWLRLVVRGHRGWLWGLRSALWL